MQASRILSLLFVPVLVLALSVQTAAAQAFLDPPSVRVLRTSHTSVTLEVTTGSTGAPAGFWIDWTPKSEFDAMNGWGGQVVYCAFTLAPTLNTTDGTESFVLDPNEKAIVEIGDLFDETGIVAADRQELEDGSQYVFRSYAMGTSGAGWSPYSPNVVATTQSMSYRNCTYTQGYWKNHPEDWPVLSLTLGSVNYTSVQLMKIFKKSAAGNGLVSMAHQLIAAKLNIANGAIAPPEVLTAISDADALIGALVVPPIGSGYLAPAVTSPLTETLDRFNNGTLGPGHCDVTPGERLSWGAIKARH